MQPANSDGKADNPDHSTFHTSLNKLQ